MEINNSIISLIFHNLLHKKLKTIMNKVSKTFINKKIKLKCKHKMIKNRTELIIQIIRFY